MIRERKGAGKNRFRNCISVSLVIILVSCSYSSPPAHQSQLTVTAQEPNSIQDHTETLTPTPTATPKPSRPPFPSKIPIPTATERIKTYPTKKALVVYGTRSRNQYTANFIWWGDFYLEPYLVLYEDGQLIFGTGKLEKQLSQQDTEKILTELEQLGFFQIQDTYALDTENPLYVFPTEVIPDPNLTFASIELTVEGEEESKSVLYMSEWENHLIEPMKEIVSFLDSISSDGATPYQPDRLLITLDSEGEKWVSEGTLSVPWPQDVISPAYRSDMGALYLEGADARNLYKATGGNLYGYFSFEGKNYFVYLRPILPHECHIYHFYQEVPLEQPYFNCDDW